jgi:hypothetical protein
MWQVSLTRVGCTQPVDFYTSMLMLFIGVKVVVVLVVVVMAVLLRLGPDPMARLADALKRRQGTPARLTAGASGERQSKGTNLAHRADCRPAPVHQQPQPLGHANRLAFFRGLGPLMRLGQVASAGLPLVTVKMVFTVCVSQCMVLRVGVTFECAAPPCQHIHFCHSWCRTLSFLLVCLRGPAPISRHPPSPLPGAPHSVRGSSRSTR